MSDVTQSAIQERVIAAIREINPDLESTAIEPSTEFEALDMDSLDRVELAQIMEEAYGVKLSSDSLGEIKTVADAVGLIELHAREASPA